MSNSVLNASDLKKDLLEITKSNQDFTILSKIILNSKLSEILEDQGSYTFFAPSDTAFQRLPKDTLNSLLQPENSHKLNKLLKSHITKGELLSVSASSQASFKTLNNQEAQLTYKGSSLYVNQSLVIKSDIKSNNGVIHMIDNIILPNVSTTSQEKTHSKTHTGQNSVKTAIQILEETTNIGVDLFNAGNERACSVIYKIAVISIIEIKPSNLSSEDIEKLKKALDTASSNTNHTENAWTLRKAIDHTYSKLRK